MKQHPSWDAEKARKEIMDLMIDGLDDPEAALHRSCEISVALQEAGAAAYRIQLADHLGMDVYNRSDVSHMEIIRFVGMLEGRAAAQAVRKR